ncbi:hypothetical protein NLI96_g2378 [Meripilus lineatus]|uniref:Uncharacterized protein n=1 Tax=Meripilus lineatus TaxID=2056292 RepID=A0AAD5VAT6_9APHY|nr:hypothetical protein NLI96_g2378 [Physisporinus lineatus]
MNRSTLLTQTTPVLDLKAFSRRSITMQQGPPPLGTKPFNARANMFLFHASETPKINPSPLSEIHPPVPQNKRACQIIDKLQLSHPAKFTPRAIYDGVAIMFSTRDDLGETYTVNMAGKVRPDGRGIFRVSITRVGMLDPQHFKAALSASDKNLQLSGEHQDAVSLLQLIVKQSAIRRHEILPQARYFLSLSESIDISRGLSVCRGFSQSIRPLCGKLLVNIDTVHIAVYKGGHLGDLALAFLNERNLRVLMFESSTDRRFRELQSFLKGVRVRPIERLWQGGNPPPYKPIKKLIPQAGRHTFPKGEDKRETSVEQHFREKYGYTLQQPLVFGVQIGQSAVLPAEVCEVARGQPYRKRLVPDQQSKMITVSKMDPPKKLQMIKNAVAGDEFNYASCDVMRMSGMSVSHEAVDVNGWMFDEPQVQYGRNRPVRVNMGGWNLKGQQFYEPRLINGWAVVDFASTEPQRFVDKLASNLRNLNILRPAAPPPPVFSGNRQSPESSLQGAAQEASPGVYPDGSRIKPSFLVVILPKHAPEIRHRVKYWGNVITGIPTQCVRDGKFSDDDQYCNNVCLKIHAKIGGINSRTYAKAIVDHVVNNGIVAGCDVSHPPPGNQTRPSVASLVSSYDRGALNFERVIMFRDGVSDGELRKVREEEIASIKRLLHQMPNHLRKDGKVPKLVFIVVTKRHHVRFFPTQRGQTSRAVDQNCPAGFVVDRDIVYSTPMDFYLLSHAGLIGTSRPSHYIVLENECNFSMRQIQELSYVLCHNYAAATRSVSIPAPVYYADRLCAYVEYNMDPNTIDMVGSTTGSEQQQTCDLSLWKAAERSQLSDQLYFL